MSQLWMVSYDISNHKQRKLVHDLLKDHGQRVQFSVFECRLSHAQQQALREKLQTYLSSDDSLRWYPLCNWCEGDVYWQGKGNVIDPNEYYLL